MSVDKIISTLIEGLEDDDDLKDVALTGALKDEDIKYWSHYMRSWRFDTEDAARQRVFELLQHHDKSPGPFEPWGESRNRYFSQAIPVYKDRFGKFRVGAPLMTWVKAKRQAANQRRQEYLERAMAADKASFQKQNPGWTYPGFGKWFGSLYREDDKLGESEEDDFDIKEVASPEQDVMPDQLHGMSATLGGKRESYEVYSRGVLIGKIYTYHDEGERKAPANWSNGQRFYWELAGDLQQGREWTCGYASGKDWAVGEVMRAYRRNQAELDKIRKENEARFGGQNESFHSDFSDGTAGEPSAPAPFTQGPGEHPGLPDYKYLERQAKWRKRLKALIQRRDPDGIERRIGESEEDDFDIKEVAGPDIHYEKTAAIQPDHHYVRVIFGGDENHPPGDFFLGTVWREEPPPSRARVPALLKLDQEFPWTAHPVSYQYSGRARFRTMEEAGNWLYAVRFKLPSGKLPDEFMNRWNKIPLGGGDVQEGMEDDEEDLKDLHSETPCISVSEFVNAYQAIAPGHWGRSDWWKYLFGVSNRGDEQRLHDLIKQEKLSIAHVWTVWSFTARPKNVYVSPGMKLPSTVWALDKVFGYFLTRQAGEGTVYQLSDHCAYDLG